MFKLVYKSTGALLSAAMLLLVGQNPARASIIFFTNPSGLQTAMSSAGNVSLGTETFEESTLPAASMAFVNDALTQGVANGSFANGLTVPITLQSNRLGTNATVASPHIVDSTGTPGLATDSAGNIYGAVSDDVTPTYTEDSLDFIFAPSTQLNGLGFNPFSQAASLLQIQVCDLNNVLLNSTNINADDAETAFLGIQATGTDHIGRISIASLTNQYEGGDNIQLFQAGPHVQPVPEVPTGLLMLLGLSGLIAFQIVQSRRKSPVAIRRGLAL